MAPSATSLAVPGSRPPNSARRPSRQRLRRLSSYDARSDELGDGPTVIVPPHNVDVEGEASEVATSMELARRQMDGLKIEEEDEGESEDAGGFSIDFIPTKVTGKYAFAFDIDGVLIKGGEPIPEAIHAMKMLNGQNNRGIKVPYIFVTNGGGKTEKERCIQLSKQLEIEVSPGQFICGHTPMREMAETFSTVLVVGGEGEKCREVALGYGFEDVVTPGDIIKTKHDTTPFRTLTQEEWNNSKERDLDNTKIEAIFVFADSRDWGSDQQIILDLLTSKGGVLGTRSETFDEGPPLFFAHNDLVWATSHHSVRIGMGALRRSVEAMFEAVTGKVLETTAFGKPQIGTFEYATRLLQQWRKDTHSIDAPPDTIYFVGDTPESDIRGTNDYNEHSANDWYSILVETGVYRAGTKPKYEPRVTVKTVLDAVRHGMERELRKESTKRPSGSALKEMRKMSGSLEGSAIEDPITNIPESPAAEAAAEQKDGLNGAGAASNGGSTNGQSTNGVKA